VTPFSAFSLAAGAFQGLAQLGMMQGGGDGNGNQSRGPARPDSWTQGTGTQPQARGLSANLQPIRVVPAPTRAGGGGSEAQGAQATAAPAKVKTPVDDGLTAALAPSNDAPASDGITPPWKPAIRNGGGGALPPRGGSGSGALSSTISAVQGHSPRSRAPSAPAPPPNIPGMFIPPTPQSSLIAGNPAGATATRNIAARRLHGGGGGVVLSPDTGGNPPAGPTITENPWSLPYSPIGGPLNSPLVQFPYYPLYTLDYIQGNVLFPGGYQLATLDGNVDLRAQVKNTTGVSFSWNTSGLTNATNIATSGNGHYDLTFTWDSLVTTAATDSVTLTATDVNSHQESQTYYFEVPAGNIGGNTGTANWPTSLSPDTVSQDAASWGSDGVSVDANSGALDTTLSLPAYNSNIPGLALT
jgi:hypothetical protein